VGRAQVKARSHKSNKGQLQPDMNNTEILPGRTDLDLREAVHSAVGRMDHWLGEFGETSQDLYDFYATKYGQLAKRIYYRRPLAGTLCVAPLVFMEAFAPAMRGWFWPKTRFPLADAHYAMGFTYLHQATGRKECLSRAKQFLGALERTRCPGFKNYCWGYPFDWETNGGNMRSGTPLITTVPYCYEAFAAVKDADGDDRYTPVLESIAEHIFRDYAQNKIDDRVSSTSYGPKDNSRIVNANAYRAYALTRAAKDFQNEPYGLAGERNLNFVLRSQRDDGSWLYSTDGLNTFTDHFHTCFVMKALAKIELLTGHQGSQDALERGVRYYFDHLVDKNDLPLPFSRKPRLILHKRELYDYAECVNLCLLLRHRFGDFDRLLKSVIADLLKRWQHPDGFFRTRELLVGWNEVPMHRWGLSIAFRSLCLYLRESTNPGTLY
jgi:hypothetical protein